MSVQTVLRQSNLKFRPEEPGIISISLTLACSILKSLFRSDLTCYMSWWRWMVSDSNKFVLIRSEGRVSVGKQLVLRTASTYQLLVKAPSWFSFWWKAPSWWILRLVIKMMRLYSDHQVLCDRRDANHKRYWDCRFHILSFSSWCKHDNYIKQVNCIVTNFLSHHKKRYLFRFVDENK